MSEMTKRTLPVHLDILAQLTCLSVDLYPIMQELLVRSAIKNTIVGRLGEVNSEFVLEGGGLRGRGGFRLFMLPTRTTTNTNTARMWTSEWC